MASGCQEIDRQIGHVDRDLTSSLSRIQQNQHPAFARDLGEFFDGLNDACYVGGVNERQ